MGKRLESHESELRDAVMWAEECDMENFAKRHPSLARIAMAASTIEDLAEDIAAKGNLNALLGRYKAALAARRSEEM